MPPLIFEQMMLNLARISATNVGGAIVSCVSRRSIQTLALNSKLKPSNQTVAQFFDAKANEYEHRDLLIVPHQKLRMTFNEVKTHIESYTEGFHEANIARNDNIGLFVPNESEQIIISSAIIKLGAKCHLSSPAAVTNLERLLNTFKFKSFFFTPTYGKINNAGIVKSVIEEYEYLPFGVPFKSAKFPFLKFAVNCGFERIGQIYNLQGMKMPNPYHAESPKAVRLVQPSDVAYVFLPSSDTNTGVQSNGSALTQGDVVARASSIADSIGLTLNDRICLATNGGEAASLLVCKPRLINTKLRNVSKSTVTHVARARAVFAATSRGCAVVTVDDATLGEKLLVEHSCNVLVTTTAHVDQLARAPLPPTLQKLIVVGETDSNVTNSLKSIEAAKVQVFTAGSL